MDTKYADNIAYLSRKAYQITIIDPDADSELPGKVGALSLSRFDQHFTSDNLNHDVYNIYY